MLQRIDEIVASSCVQVYFLLEIHWSIMDHLAMIHRQPMILVLLALIQCCVMTQ